MNDRQAIDHIKNTIQTYLTDPRYQHSSTSRTWAHTDEPLANATYPRIYIRKRGQSNNQIIGMGCVDFWEKQEVILDIFFLTKRDFRWVTGTTTLTNERLVAEYQGKIWQDGIKPYASALWDNYSITGLKNMGESEVIYDSDTQLYKGFTSVRFWYFFNT